MQPIPPVNKLLAALPRKTRQQLIARCEKVDLILDEILNKPGDVLQYVYFPIDGSISLVSQANFHSQLEVALIGNEGMLGIASTLGNNTSMLHVYVQGEGSAWRMKTTMFRRELRHNPALKKIINNYIFVRLSQTEQSVSCMRFHFIESRLARWLLMRQDRACSDELHVTQASLANILGVRRVGITNAASSLQNRELISYTRGVLTILNRKGLEAASCGCYQTDNEIYDRIMV